MPPASQGRPGPAGGVPCYDVHGEVPGAPLGMRKRQEYVTSSPGETASSAGPVGPVAVIIPTYNERDNIELITSRVRGAVPGAHVLIVDDNSPDGTGELADKLAGEDPHVHVLHRRARRASGRPTSPGSAGRWSGTMAPWWRWTRTARTSRRR